MKIDLRSWFKNRLRLKSQLKPFKHFLNLNHQIVASSDDAVFYQIGHLNNKEKLEGIVQTFYKNGTLNKSEEYVNGIAHGEFSDYYPNGQLSLRQYKENGYNVGKKYKWYPTGQMQEESEHYKHSGGMYLLQNYWYEDGEQAIIQGKGELIRYEETNRTYYHETYENGYLIKGVSCDEKGQEHFYGLEGEILPVFPGGTAKLFSYLSDNLCYPVPARRKNIQGKVFVSFVISSDGTIKDVTITKGLGYGCDEEVIRVVSNMPKWIPGYQSGRAVPVRYSMPITFTLQSQ